MLVFLLLIFWSHLNILDLNPLLDKCVMDIFFFSVVVCSFAKWGLLNSTFFFFLWIPFNLLLHFSLLHVLLLLFWSGARWGSSVYFPLDTAVHLFQQYLLKALSFLHWVDLMPFSKINVWVSFWIFHSFHWWMCILFLCQYQLIQITITLCNSQSRNYKSCNFVFLRLFYFKSFEFPYKL